MQKVSCRAPSAAADAATQTTFCSSGGGSSSFAIYPQGLRPSS
jgi:hypothetical protein